MTGLSRNSGLLDQIASTPQLTRKSPLHRRGGAAHRDRVRRHRHRRSRQGGLSGSPDPRLPVRAVRAGRGDRRAGSGGETPLPQPAVRQPRAPRAGHAGGQQAGRLGVCRRRGRLRLPLTSPMAKPRPVRRAGHPRHPSRAARPGRFVGRFPARSDAEGRGEFEEGSPGWGGRNPGLPMKPIGNPAEPRRVGRLVGRKGAAGGESGGGAGAVPLGSPGGWLMGDVRSAAAPEATCGRRTFAAPRLDARSADEPDATSTLPRSPAILEASTRPRETLPSTSIPRRSPLPSSCPSRHAS
jgi:hypothetical protein